MRSAWIGLGLFIAACGKDAVGPERARGLRIVEGGTATDTVATTRTQALIVELRDTTGNMVPAGTVVRFTAANAFIAPVDGAGFTSFIAREVDAGGRAAVLVRFGTVSGTGRVIVNVPTLGLTDTASYTILPGAASRVTIAPADTLIGVGRSLSYRGGVVDQFGNRRDDPVSWSADPAATVTANGVLTTAAVARYRVTATATIGGTSRSATALASAVPNVRVAAWRGGTMILMDLDGGAARGLALVSDGGIGGSAEWLPNREGIVYSTLIGDVQRLVVSDTLGAVRPFLATIPAGMTHQAEPRVAAGGQWLIFGAYEPRCSAYCLYRARIDGTGAELLSSSVSGGNPVFAPSPDGMRVAVSLASATGVRVFDVATRTMSSWSVSGGTSPAWSPDGSKIAVIQGNALVLISPDGTPIKTVTTSARSATARIAWLPDSRFLMARSTSGLFDLIDTQSNVEIPLPFTSGVAALSVR